MNPFVGTVAATIIIMYIVASSARVNTNLVWIRPRTRFTNPTSTKKMNNAIGVLIFRAMYDPRGIILPYGAATPMKKDSIAPTMNALTVRPEDN